MVFDCWEKLPPKEKDVWQLYKAQKILKLNHTFNLTLAFLCRHLCSFHSSWHSCAPVANTQHRFFKFTDESQCLFWGLKRKHKCICMSSLRHIFLLPFDFQRYQDVGQGKENNHKQSVRADLVLPFHLLSSPTPPTHSKHLLPPHSLHFNQCYIIKAARCVIQIIYSWASLHFFFVFSLPSKDLNHICNTANLIVAPTAWERSGSQ